MVVTAKELLTTMESTLNAAVPSPGPASTLAPAHATFVPASRKRVVAGWVVSGLAILMLAFDSGVKLTHAPQVATSLAQLGWAADMAPALGWLGLVLLVAYAVPRTAAIGAVLWTGYLGGAIATHLRVGNPLATHTLFPLYVAALLWGGLALRDPRVVRFFLRGGE